MYGPPHSLTKLLIYIPLLSLSLSPPTHLKSDVATLIARLCHLIMLPLNVLDKFW